MFVPLDKFDGFVVHAVDQVLVVSQDRFDGRVDMHIGMKIRSTGNTNLLRDQHFIEPILTGTVFDTVLVVSGQMPFADHTGGIPLILQHLRQRDQVRRQVIVGVLRKFVVGEASLFKRNEPVRVWAEKIRDPVSGRCLPGQQPRARRTAHGRAGICSGEPHACPGHRINVGRLVERVPVTPWFPPAQVIDQDEYDVLLLFHP